MSLPLDLFLQAACSYFGLLSSYVEFFLEAAAFLEMRSSGGFYAVSRLLSDGCLLLPYIGQLLKSKVLFCLCTSAAKLRSLMH